MIDHLTVPVIWRIGSTHSSLTVNEVAVPLSESTQYSPGLDSNPPGPVSAAKFPAPSVASVAIILPPPVQAMPLVVVPGTYTVTLEPAGNTEPAMAALPVDASQVARLIEIDGAGPTLTVTVADALAVPPGPVAVSV